MIGSVISMVWLFSLDLNAQNQMKCFALMAATALFTGVHISPLVNLAVNIDPQLVMSAFLLTSLVFVCFTLSALFTSKRTYLYLGGKWSEASDFPIRSTDSFFVVAGLLSSGVSLMLFLSLLNIFGRSELIFNVRTNFSKRIRHLIRFESFRWIFTWVYSLPVVTFSSTLNWSLNRPIVVIYITSSKFLRFQVQSIVRTICPL